MRTFVLREVLFLLAARLFLALEVLGGASGAAHLGLPAVNRVTEEKPQ
jgi:hypothetical protein